MIAAVTLIATGISGSKTSGAAVTDRTSTASGGQARPVGAVALEHCRDARRGLAFYRAAYDRTLARMGRAGEEWRRARGCAAVRYLAAVARAKARAARRAFARWQERRRAYFAALYEKWRCIHEHEGAWDDPNPPHWGGLQFDLSFQRTYGPEFFARWGTADRWPVWAQLETAERAWRVRGFYPWPNTARACGLI